MSGLSRSPPVLTCVMYRMYCSSFSLSHSGALSHSHSSLTPTSLSRLTITIDAPTYHE